MNDENQQPKHDGRVSVGVFLLGVVSVLPFFSLYETASINDEGIVCLGAFRLWLGDAVFTDFTTHFAPGTYFLTLIFYYLFGPSVFATRALMAVISGLLTLSIYLVAARVLPGRYRFVPSLLFLCAGVTQWPVLSYHWGGVMALLYGTVALLNWDRRPTRGTAVTCGASFAFACWMLQSEAAALLLLTGLVTIDRRKEMTRQDFLYWFCGMAGLSAVLWAPILLRTSLADVWQQNVVWALFHNADPGVAPYDLGHLTVRWSAFLTSLAKAQQWNGAVLLWVVQSLSYLTVWSINYGLIHPVLVVSVVLAWRVKESRPMRIVLYAQLAGSLAWQSRQTLLYVNFLTPLFFVLMVYLALHSKKVGKVALAGISACYICAYLFWATESLDYRYPITTVRGTLYSRNPVEAQRMNQLFRAAAELSPPGTKAFCYPYAMGFAYLSGVRPVARLPLVIPILGPDDEVPNLLNELRESKPPFIYHLPWSPDTLHAVPNVDKEKFWSLVEEYNQQIQEGYEPIAQVGPAHIFKRKSEE